MPSRIPESTIHKYGTGSCSDRVQASLQSTSNVQINWFNRVNKFKLKLTISHRAPGRYSSRFRICAALVELYSLAHIERTSTALSKLNPTQFVFGAHSHEP
jgi:hypothetical protein